MPPVGPENEEGNVPEGESTGEALERVIQVAGMYNNYFLDYASYESLNAPFLTRICLLYTSPSPRD